MDGRPSRILSSNTLESNITLRTKSIEFALIVCYLVDVLSYVRLRDASIIRVAWPSRS